MTKSSMIEEIRQMSPRDRIELMRALLDEMAQDAEVDDLSEAQKAELLRRRDAHRADPSQGIPWETVRAEMRERYPR